MAPELRGRGASADLPGPYGLDRHVDDICRLARALGDKVVLIGHSMGAYVALPAAAAHPDIFSRLILAGPIWHRTLATGFRFDNTRRTR